MKYMKISLYIFCIGMFFSFFDTVFANDSLEVIKEIWQSNNVFEEKSGRYSISNKDCEVIWEVIEFKDDNADNYFDIRHISNARSCGKTFLQQRHLHKKVLGQIFSEWNWNNFSNVHVFGLQRLEPSGTWNNMIAEASAESADWIDWRTNYPHHSSGKSVNAIFVELANACNAYKELSDLFRELGYSIMIKNVEKVEHAQTKPTLLYDSAIIYFSMERIKGN